MSAPIEIRNLTKRFGDVTALDSISLSIEPGEFLVLLGPSGCGKTTLLRCLAGLETPDDGEIFIDGKLVFSAARGISLEPGKRNIGMVFQSYALWPHMSVDENIGFGLSIQKLPKQEIKDRVDGVLKDMSMSGLGRRYPSELSGGQQQRVAVARLLASKPPVFLMDEPLSNLDARLRIDLRTELKRLHHDSGATTVYVTHDQSEAMELASQVAVMEKGEIKQLAPPLEIYHRPATLFVADFVSITPLNLIPAQIEKKKGRTWANAKDFSIPLSWTPDADDISFAARAEDVTLSLEPAEDAIECTVYAVLPTGPELIIQAQCGETMVTARETRQLDLQMDQPVWLKFDTSASNIYDNATGKRLLPPDESISGDTQQLHQRVAQ
jgi:multiple sugar transport system ATP-binding protein